VDAEAGAGGGASGSADAEARTRKRASGGLEFALGGARAFAICLDFGGMRYIV
jgi:hypothetical protein